jgi:hypothetical protein
MKTWVTICFLAFLLSSTEILNAQANYAVSLRAGSQGIGVEGVRSITDNLNIRVGGYYFHYTYDGGGGSLEYNYSAKVKFFSVGGFADWFPWANNFKVTAGLIINLNKGDMDARPYKTYTIGGDLYTPEKLGTLNAKITFNSVAPYLGVGYGNRLIAGSGLRFSVDVGTYYQGSPSVALTANGLIKPSAAPDQEQKLEDNINWFKFYPIVSFGLSYNF